MRVCFMAGLLVLVLGANTEGKPISNARNLIDNEWSSQHNWTSRDAQNSTTTFAGRTFRMLSLRPSDEWDSGTAWFVVFRITATYRGSSVVDTEVSGEAFKGFYSIKLDATDDDVLALELGFTKSYSCSATKYNEGNFRLKWERLVSFKPEGADFLLTMDDGDAIPEDELELSVDRGYYVDAYGRETALRYEPDTLFERLAGRGSVRTLRRLSFAEIGETIRLQRGDAMEGLLKRETPPAYRHRDNQVTPRFYE